VQAPGLRIRFIKSRENKQAAYPAITVSPVLHLRMNRPAKIDRSEIGEMQAFSIKQY
jgi:hypothetical protein